jgi:hypothetical protein
MGFTVKVFHWKHQKGIINSLIFRVMDKKKTECSVEISQQSAGGMQATMSLYSEKKTRKFLKKLL